MEIREALIEALDVTAQTGAADLKTLNNVLSPCWVTTLFLKADPANGATPVKVGGKGISTYPLIAGEAVAIDIPEGFAIDLAKIGVDGNGAGGQIVHFLYVRLAG